MTAYIIGLAALPLAGTLAALLGAHARGAGYAAIGAALVSFALSIGLLARTLGRGSVLALNGFVYVDGLSAFFLMTISLVIVLASLGSAAYLRSEEARGELSGFQVRLYFTFFGLFAALMLGSLSTGNLGLLFVLIEASTLASAALVGIEGKPTSLEAAWKYVIISSLGVTIALVGTLFLFYSASALQLTGNLRLTWPYLYQHAAALSAPSLRLAFLLAVIGYGTKVGLAPMHTWLPDAHSEAPSPASAMLSAALLNTGMYAIIRFVALASAGLGEPYVHNVLLGFGFASITIAALFMVRRGNFKRLFAYSSVEHMGIVAVALGFGGTLGMYGALLQILNHAVGKSVLFLSSGDVVLGYQSREASRVRGLLTALPLSGMVLLLGSFAVLGGPPFGLFLSELTIVRAGFTAGTPWLPALLLLLLLVAFVGFARTTTGMIFGPVDTAALRVPYPTRPIRMIAAIPLLVGLGLLLVLGLWIPTGLDSVIMHAIQAVT
ncbi:MAG: proton-conducting transporter transmembrane domain-containing protein [Mycobacteriales bacterium]